MSNLNKYLNSFVDYVDVLIYNQRELEFYINNFDELVGILYDSHEAYDKWTRNEVMTSLLMAYLYARPQEFDMDSIKRILNNYFENIDYYKDLYKLQTGFSSASSSFSPKDIQFYLHIGDLISKMKSGQKHLIK